MGELGRHGAFAVGREAHMRHRLAHGHGVDQLDFFARDAQHRDRVVGPVGNEREVARAVDGQAGRLLADEHGVDQRGWAGGQVDDKQAVVGYLLEHAVLADDIERIGQNGQRFVGRDGQVDGRAGNGVGQHQVGDDSGGEWVGADIQNRQRVFARRRQQQLASGVPRLLFVVGDDHQLAFARGWCGGRAARGPDDGCCQHGQAQQGVATWGER